MEARERQASRCPRSAVRDLGWAPTISLSWLWGLGFFFSFHMVLTYGWLGFAMFALPNAFGLFAFGWILGDRRRDPSSVFRQVQSRFAGLFLASQVLAVAITVFAVIDYLLIPLLGQKSLGLMAIVVTLSIAVGHAATIQGLRLVHALYMVVGLVAAVILLVTLSTHVAAPPVPFAAFDPRFYGLVLPSLVGFLLGPWTDVQHWQRVVAIRADGGSVRRAYAAGALLFLGMIALNAAIAGAAGPALVTVASDGLPGLQSAVAGAVATLGRGSVAMAAYLVWAGVATASTLDSFYSATRWLLRATTAESKSPLMAFAPAGLVTSPIWFLAAALLLAVLAVAENVAMIFLMIAYATLFVGAATNLVCEVITGERRYDGVLCLMIGLTAFLVFAAGYLGDMPEMVALAPIVGMIGASSALLGVFGWSRDARPAPAPTDDVPEPALPIPADQRSAAIDTVHLTRSHGFEGQWYVMNLTPTYDDTNSLGNIYFANYFKWIGRARELMFNDCMPDFDVKTTDFYILTKDFQHQFRREVSEFEPVTVRLRITTVNRKFVTIIHEIKCAAGLIGKGEQSLMFVDAVAHKPLDIPASVLRSFLPYYEKVSRPGAPAAAVS